MRYYDYDRARGGCLDGGCCYLDSIAECLFDDNYDDDSDTFYTLDTNFTESNRTIFSDASGDTRLSLRSAVTSRSRRYASRRDDGHDKISKRLQSIDERNKTLTKGANSFPVVEDDELNRVTRIGPLPTVQEDPEENQATSSKRSGPVEGNNREVAALPSSASMSVRSAKTDRSSTTQKTSTSAKSFPGSTLVARAGTSLRSSKRPEVKLPDVKLPNVKQRVLALHAAAMSMTSPRAGRSMQRDDIEACEVLDNRDDNATTDSKVPDLFRGEIDDKDERESNTFEEEVSASNNGKVVTTVKSAADAMGSALTVLNVKKMMSRHDTVKRANAIEAVARKYSDLGQWDVAERNYMESLRIKKVGLPKGHTEIINTMDLLAMARMEQGNYVGAIEPVSASLEARRKAKGPDDQGVINRLHSLAFLCRITGDNAKLAQVEKEINTVCKVPAM